MHDTVNALKTLQASMYNSVKETRLLLYGNRGGEGGKILRVNFTLAARPQVMARFSRLL